MFTLGLREGLEAALIVALLASLARGTDQVKRLAVSVMASVALSTLLVIVVRRLHLQLDESTLHTIKAVVAVGAVLALTSIIRWSASLVASTDLAVQFVRSGAIGSVAFLAVAREGLELAVFPGAGETAGWGPGHIAMVAGVVVAAGIGVGVFVAFRLAPERLIAITSIVLALIAAGMAAAALRSGQIALGWGSDPLFDATWLYPTSPEAQVLLKGLLGVHATPTLLEVIAYVAYLVVLAGLLWWSLRRLGGWRRPVEPGRHDLATALHSQTQQVAA